MLAPFIAHCVGLVYDIGDGNVGSSMTFQESFNKYSIEWNGE